MKRLADVQLETSENLQINMSPLIDMVFLLLIFFMVTAVFVEEEAVPVEKPLAQSGAQAPTDALRFTVSAGNTIYYGDGAITLDMVGTIVRRQTTAQPPSVIVIADQKASAETMVSVLDHAKQAGATEVSIATKREDH